MANRLLSVPVNPDSPVDDSAAIRLKYLPRQIVRVIASKKHETRRDFVALAGAAHRPTFAEILFSGLEPPIGSSGVQIGAGGTAFTRMPVPVRVSDKDRVKTVIEP
jgi:hypothetical protein